MMTAAGMRAQIQAAQATLGDPEVYPSVQAYLDAAMLALCTGIIQEIQLNAQVTAAVTVAGVSLVQPGLGASGPGTGTATGTIS